MSEESFADKLCEFSRNSGFTLEELCGAATELEYNINELLGLLERIYLKVNMNLGHFSETRLMEEVWDLCNSIIEDQDNMGFHKRIQKTLAENNWDHLI